MALPIAQTFIDTSDLIYTVDPKGILYLYAEHYFTPFPKLMNQIHVCFSIGPRFFVHHEQTMSIFQGPHLDRVETVGWVSNTIDKACCYADCNIIVTLEAGLVFFHFNAVPNSNPHSLQTSRYSLSNIRQNIGRSTRTWTITDDIKIIDNYCLVWYADQTEIFRLSADRVTFEHKTSITKSKFDSTHQVHDISLLVHPPADETEMLRRIISQPINNLKLPGNRMFKEHGLYTYIEGQTLISFHTSASKAHIQALGRAVAGGLDHTQTTIEFENALITHTAIPSGTTVEILNGYLTQVFLINSRPYTHDMYESVCAELALNETQINFAPVHLNEPDKSGADELVIDVYQKRPVLDQLLPIIPYLYRLNRELEFKFHQINDKFRVMSYGDGVTRQVFTELRRELDELFETKFKSMPNLSSDPVVAQNLGRVLYFCCQEGAERFNHIDPYFFYLLAPDSHDHEALIRNFHPDNKLYLKLYRDYKTDPSQLQLLDMDLTTIDDYVEHMLSINIDPIHKQIYQQIYKGYTAFAERELTHTFTKHLPAYFHINRLLADGYFVAEFRYTSTQTVTVVKMQEYARIFSTIFDEFTQEERATFLKNITGSEYYADTVDIVFAARAPTDIVMEQFEHDEDVILSDGEAEEHLRALVPTLIQILQEGIAAPTPPPPDHPTTYDICTCYTRLTINVEPTEANIREIMMLLKTDDSYLEDGQPQV